VVVGSELGTLEGCVESDNLPLRLGCSELRRGLTFLSSSPLPLPLDPLAPSENSRCLELFRLRKEVVMFDPEGVRPLDWG
jgi:hypothetical protein